MNNQFGCCGAHQRAGARTSRILRTGFFTLCLLHLHWSLPQEPVKKRCIVGELRSAFRCSNNAAVVTPNGKIVQRNHHTARSNEKFLEKAEHSFLCCYVMGILHLWPRFSVDWLHRAVDIWEGNMVLRGGGGGGGWRWTAEGSNIRLKYWLIAWRRGSSIGARGVWKEWSIQAQAARRAQTAAGMRRPIAWKTT